MTDLLTSLVTYVQSSGGMGAGLFTLVFIAATLLFFPASLLHGEEAERYPTVPRSLVERR